ncbi:hypothetical protein ACJQWK_04493 [Exserohilum turcicum]
MRPYSRRLGGWGICILMAQYGTVHGARVDYRSYAAPDRREEQQRLQQADYARIASAKDSEELSFMGYDGFLTLVNGSPFNWTLAGQHSYQMDTWSWPSVSAGAAAKVHVEFGGRGHTQDDAGEAYYSIDGTSNKFTVLARKQSDFQLTISLDGMSTEQSPEKSDIQLGFRHDAAVNWILSSDEAGNFWSNSASYAGWMQQSMGSLANRTLRHICMPGSHDAGMTTFQIGTVGANFPNTQTQYLNFYQQLLAGSRYFDLRPVISRGKWVAGHYSKVGNIWVGGNGEDLSTIIQQVNDFTAKYKELVIINISHSIDTDKDYKDLSQAQWNDLFTTLTKLNYRFTINNPSTTDLSRYKLADFITDRASILLIVELPRDITLGAFANQGIYTSANFPTYNAYSKTNNLATMQQDQLAKLRAQRKIVGNAGARKGVFHVFSWTLTQDVNDVLNYDRAIMNMATDAFDALISNAWPAFTPQSFPNVLYVDSLGVRDKSVAFPFLEPKKNLPVNVDIAAFAVAVNNAVAGRNAYVLGM